MIRYTRDNGVSPAIAVLLILAMTVVAAGIVAVVATGMAGDFQNGKQVGLIVKPAASGGDVLVTVVSGKDVPELTKLEVIDGGAADAKFREVRLSDGGEVASFTAGAGYVAKNVATPSSGMQSYTVPIIVKGTFKDGTEVVLLNTKCTFIDVKSPLYSFVNDILMKSWNGDKINLSIANLFFSGQSIKLSLKDLSQTSHSHGLKISIPDALLQPGTEARIVMYKLDKDGNQIGNISSNYKSYAKEEQVTELNHKNPEVDRVIVTINIYNKDEYEEYKRKYGSKEDYNTNPEYQAPVISSQTGTIQIVHDI